jgi:hypothetical protein
MDGVAVPVAEVVAAVRDEVVLAVVLAGVVREALVPGVPLGFAAPLQPATSPITTTPPKTIARMLSSPSDDGGSLASALPAA